MALTDWGWLDEQPIYQGRPWLYGSPSRSGKSVLMKEMAKLFSEGGITNQLTGNELSTIISDELHRGDVFAVKRKPIEVFDDPAWPLAKVEVFLEPLAPAQPRHPNPKGSPIDEFVIVAGGRRSRPERNKRAALINAQEMHKRLVAGLELAAARDAAEAQDAPNYARF